MGYTEIVCHRLKMLGGRNTGELNHEFAEGRPVKKWECVICGYVYDEALGCPEEGIAPGTPLADIDDAWVCPDCGAPIMDFEEVKD